MQPMNERALHILEYDKIIDRLKELAHTDMGRSVCASLTPMTDRNDILTAQAETSAAEMRIIRKGSLSFGGANDVRGSVMRLEIGASLSAPELLNISRLLDAAARAKSYGSREDREDPDALDGFFSALEPLPSLNNEIKRCILSADEISDDASPALSRIRRQIREMDGRIHDQLNSILMKEREHLMDGVVTMRDGRYCLPVRAEYRQQFPGLVHDQSGSGSTYFIEPMAVIRLGNELKELTISEQKEIESILAALSNQAAEHPNELTENVRLLTHLDFVFAKAQLSRRMKGAEPVFSEDRYLTIRAARHPLLPQKTVVPIDIRLGGHFNLLVITGPNTGGKTVTLKTVGLLTLMGQSGLHIPADPGSKLAIFNDVYADIGDEQSIEQSLSTFSSHMTNIVNILKQADHKSLVLFDELGAGTDPVEGAALAMAILKRLHKRRIHTVATTHYSELKIFALSTPGVENASCEFDVATLRPTYRLLIGVPGKSNAFAISKKLGLPDDIINAAKESIGEQDEAFEDVISDLETKRKRLENDRKEAERLRAEVERLKTELDTKQQRLAEQRENYLRKAREEARQILQEAKDTADAAIRNLNKQGVRITADMEAERTRLREKISENQAQKKEKEKPVHTADVKELHIGDRVHVHSLGLSGTLSSLPNARGEVTVQMGILKSTVQLSDISIEQEETVSFKKENASVRAGGLSKALSISTELNLIGKTVDEALPELDKYLDDAYLSHLPVVRIIHGRGTGTLRTAIQNFLRKDKSRVASYRAGEFNEGGNGCTVVTLKG